MNTIFENIKKMREITKASISLCKTSLEEAGNDIDKALDILRKKGIEKAAKRTGNNSSEVVVVSKTSENKDKIVIVKFAVETDFVSKNEEFGMFIDHCANEFLNTDIDYNDINITFDLFNIKEVNFNEALKMVSGRFGENIVIQEFYKNNIVENEFYYNYCHNKFLNNSLSKISVFVKANKESDLLKKIAMHASWSKALVVYEKDLMGLEYDKNTSLEELVLEKQEINYLNRNQVISDLLKENEIVITDYKVIF